MSSSSTTEACDLKATLLDGLLNINTGPLQFAFFDAFLTKVQCSSQGLLFWPKSNSLKQQINEDKKVSLLWFIVNIILLRIIKSSHDYSFDQPFS